MFGIQVKEHRMFTLETMSKHSSSTELLQEIRQMMTQLKSYLLQSTELQAMLEPQHQYTQDKLGKLSFFMCGVGSLVHVCFTTS